MNENEVLSLLKEKFAKELPSHDFSQIDTHFYLSNTVLKEGYVGTSIERLVCSCIIDMYLSWNNYLQSLIIPNPHNTLIIEESNAFTEDEKHRFSQLISHALAFSSENALLSMKGNSRSEFITRATNFWIETYKPELIVVLEKLNKVWIEKTTELKKEEPKHYGGTV